MIKRQSHNYNYAKRIIRWVTAGMTFALVFCFAVSAYANVVYGRVYDENNNPKREATFTIKDSSGQVVKVQTDRAGNYNVFLPRSGIYIAEFAPDKRVNILSQPEPVRQDIHLR